MFTDEEIRFGQQSMRMMLTVLKQSVIANPREYAQKNWRLGLISKSQLEVGVSLNSIMFDLANETC